MAVWVRLIAVTCLVGLARWASAQLCPVTDAERYQRTAPLVTQAELGFSEDSSPLHNAVYHYDLPRIKCQVDQAQVDVNQLTSQGNSVLVTARLASPDQAAAGRGAEEGPVVKYLLSKGADPNSVVMPEYGGVENYSLIHWYSLRGNHDLVKAMVEAGGDVNAKDSRGYTPLHSAARCDYWWNDDESAAKTIAYLVSKGANITARTKGGDTVLDLVTKPPREYLNKPTWPSGTCRSTYLMVQKLMRPKPVARPQGALAAGGSRRVYAEKKDAIILGHHITCGQKDWQGKPAAFCKICGGRAAVEAACNQRPTCMAFAMDSPECGFLQAAKGPFIQIAGARTWVRA